MITPPLVENILGQRGLIPTAYYQEWELIDRLDGNGIVIREWNQAVLGPEPSQNELDLAANPLISLIITPTETGATITSQVTNGGYNGAVNWRCIDPDGMVYTEEDVMVNGADNWQIDMGKTGTYIIASWVIGYGYAEGGLTIG